MTVDVQCLNESINHFLGVIEHDLKYTSFVVSVLFHETGKGEGRLFKGRHLFYILADKRSAYLKGALMCGEAVVIQGFTVSL